MPYADALEAIHHGGGRHIYTLSLLDLQQFFRVGAPHFVPKSNVKLGLSYCRRRCCSTLSLPALSGYRLSSSFPASVKKVRSSSLLSILSG